MDVVLYVAGAIITLVAVTKILTDFLEKTVKRISTKVTDTAIDKFNEQFCEKIENMDESLRKLLEENRRSDKAVRALTLKNSAAKIYEAYSYYIRRGSITTFDLANLEEIYSIYREQGGNGHAKIYMEHMRKLPIDDKISLSLEDYRELNVSTETMEERGE